MSLCNTNTKEKIFIPLMPTKILSYFLKQFLFLLLFFAFGRLIFLIYNVDKLHGIAFFTVLAAFRHAISLDFATACYLMAFPYFLLIIQSLITAYRWSEIISIINKIYFILIILLISIITSVELPLFDEWGNKLNYKALAYLAHPSEIVNTASNAMTAIVLLVLILEFAISFFAYKKYFWERAILAKRNFLFTFLFTVIMPVLLVIGMRGGLQQIPINQSASYYSGNNTLNNVAVNSAWNTIFSFVQNHTHLDKNPYLFYSVSEADSIVKSLYVIPKDTTISLLTTNKPNIVLLIVESWSADFVKSMGGYDSVAPHFEDLINEGFLFNNIYASGERSEQGIVAILSGFPAQPTTSIIKQPDKFKQLPCIKKTLAEQGYNSSFFFGGQLSYSNIKAYLVYNGFEKIIEGEDFDSNLPRGKLAVHDEYVLSRQLKELNSVKTPFFSCLFTASTHPPYDIPMKYVFSWGGAESGMVNAAFYTDKCLANYFADARKQKWYDNTLFVIMADHGCETPKHWNFYSPQHFKIPILFYGNVLKKEYRGMKWNKVGSQIDFPATLLTQLKLDNKKFGWSKNLLNPYCPEFAYYEFWEGLGWIKPKDYFVYESNLNKMYEQKFQSAESEKQSIKEGKAYLQKVFQEYLDY